MEQLFKIEADRYEGYQLVDVASGLRASFGYDLREVLEEKKRLEAKGHRFTKRRDLVSKVIASLFVATFGLLFAFAFGSVIYFFSSLYGASETLAKTIAVSLTLVWLAGSALFTKSISGGKKKYELYPLIDLDNLPEGVVRASNE